ncbi:MAG: hypothetical protein PHV74_05385 [Dehalococcoidia bacterium]|nr:hypothetical protein [Dehalococcoidia bacterium]
MSIEGEIDLLQAVLRALEEKDTAGAISLLGKYEQVVEESLFDDYYRGGPD